MGSVTVTGSLSSGVLLVVTGFWQLRRTTTTTTTTTTLFFHPKIYKKEKFIIIVQTMIGALAARNNLRVKNASQPVERKDV